MLGTGYTDQEQHQHPRAALHVRLMVLWLLMSRKFVKNCGNQSVLYMIYNAILQSKGDCCQEPMAAALSICS